MIQAGRPENFRAVLSLFPRLFFADCFGFFRGCFAARTGRKPDHGHHIVGRGLIEIFHLKAPFEGLPAFT